jgi:hypothetical protein
MNSEPWALSMKFTLASDSESQVMLRVELIIDWARFVNDNLFWVKGIGIIRALPPSGELTTIVLLKHPLFLT